jgi:hypothetical protein
MFNWLVFAGSLLVRMQNYTATAVEVAADVAQPATRAAPHEPGRNYVPDAHHSPGEHVREHMKPQTMLRYVHAVGQGQNTRGGEAFAVPLQPAVF